MKLREINIDDDSFVELLGIHVCGGIGINCAGYTDDEVYTSEHVLDIEMPDDIVSDDIQHLVKVLEFSARNGVETHVHTGNHHVNFLKAW